MSLFKCPITSKEVEEINIKLIMGRLMPGTNKNYFMMVSEDYPANFQDNVPEEEKIHCFDCGKVVEGYKEIFGKVDKETKKPSLKRVCDHCYTSKYSPIKRLHNINTEMSNCV